MTDTPDNDDATPEPMPTEDTPAAGVDLEPEAMEAIEEASDDDLVEAVAVMTKWTDELREETKAAAATFVEAEALDDKDADGWFLDIGDEVVLTSHGSRTGVVENVESDGVTVRLDGFIKNEGGAKVWTIKVPGSACRIKDAA